MGVSRDDVRRIAALARIGVPDHRIDALVAELDGILAHMDVLAKHADVMTKPGPQAEARTSGETPLAPDEPPSVLLARPREDFAPEMRDGFFIVPRVATHDGAGADS